MTDRLIIRPERPEDYAAVEQLTRAAFYNQYVPGCAEHYLVHILRDHPDFLPGLDLVAEWDGRLAGSLMATRASLTDEQGQGIPTVSFGPLSVAPTLQRRGIGKALLARAFALAQAQGEQAVVIFGSPSNYVTSGFVSCLHHRVCLEGGLYPASLLVKELTPGALAGRRWVYRESPAMELDPEAAARFDAALPPLPKEHRPSQEEFFILSHALLRGEA